jgi:hypothetical protein
VAAPVYSQLLWDLPAGWASPPFPTSNVVPIGFVWVVREIAAYFGAGDLGGGAPFAQLLATAQPIWSSPVFAAVSGVVYRESDVRHVMNAGDFMEFSSSSASWSLRVSGYQLSSS